MTPVIVRHATGRYPVYVDPGALARLPDLVERHLAPRRVALVADDAVSVVGTVKAPGELHQVEHDPMRLDLAGGLLDDVGVLRQELDDLAFPVVPRRSSATSLPGGGLRPLSAA